MNPQLHHLIAALHQAPHQCVLALAGGGTAALAMLLNVPGGSRTVLEAVVPYSETAFVEFLGHPPAQFCSAETSRRMAVRARDRAHWLAPTELVVGLGCTATLVTDRPKRGDHRFFLSTCTESGETTCSLILEKGARTREEEEAVLDAVLLNTLAEAFGIPARITLSLRPGEAVEVERHPCSSLLGRLLEGQVPAVCMDPDSRIYVSQAEPGALLPGAFNPIHHGHWRLAEVAARRTGLSAAFELSVVNVDKPLLTQPEVRRRLAQFHWRGRVWVTRAATFREKAHLFPGSVFVVGADTAVRIVQPRYYDDQEDRMLAALDEIRHQGCRFLVAGRDDPAGRFLTGEELNLPASFRDLFEIIPESDFHVAVSSTALREQARVAAIARPTDGP